MKNLFFIFLFLFCYEVESQTYISGSKPCSGKLYVLNSPSVVDTSHTYTEAVNAYFERHLRQLYHRFDISNSKEVAVDLIRINNNVGSVLVKINTSSSKTFYITLAFSKISRDKWFKASQYDESMPDIIPFSEYIDKDVRDIRGVPSGLDSDYILEQSILQNGTSSFISRFDTSGVFFHDLIMNPVLSNDKKYSPRAYLSNDNRWAALYLFVPEYVNPYEGNYSVVRFLADLEYPTRLIYSSVPASIFGIYGFDQGNCVELGFY